MQARTITSVLAPVALVVILAGCAVASPAAPSSGTTSATAPALPTELSSIPEKAKGYLDENEAAALAKAKTNRITAEDIRGPSDQQIIDKVSLKKSAISSIEDFGAGFAHQLDIATMAGTTPEEFQANGGPSSYTPEKGNALAARYDRPLTTAISGAEAQTDSNTADAHAFNVRMASNMKRVSMPQQYDCVTATTGIQLISGSIESRAFTAKVAMISMDNVSESGYGKWLVENGLGYDKDDIGKGVFTVSSRLQKGVWLTQILNRTGSNVSKALPK